MNKYIIKVEPQSYLLCSNAETGGAFDSQFVFDENGFPYFPAKTFKGLLKESMIEVLEMQGEKTSDIIKKIGVYFGNEGDKYNEGILSISNLNLSGYESQNLYFRSKSKLKKHQIQQYFISQIQQTALNEDETAKDKSLRYYAVLNYNRATSFQTQIRLDENQFQLIEQSLKNLRYAGTRRNRGFGKVKCTIEKDVSTTESAIPKPEWSESSNAIKVKITLNEPIVLGTQNTDTNTVNSQDFVSGNQLLGMLAWQYKKGAKGEDFEELFLQNNLIFENCYPFDAKPLPLAFHQEKYCNEPKRHNILNKSEGFDEVTKTIGGLVKDNQSVGINKHFNFHASRPERSAGRSTKNQTTGGIFYYESIDKGTTFEGLIRGENTTLEKLYAAFQNEELFRLGKSKSSQYGEVQVILEPHTIADSEVQATGTYYMVLESPLIVLNENGFPEPTEKYLLQNIPNIEIESATASICMVEQYNSTWLAKTGKVAAFKEGSTFKVKIKESASKKQFWGEWNEKGFGKVSFYTESEINQHLEAYQQSNEIALESDEIPTFISNIKQEVDSNIENSKIKSNAYKDAGRKVNRFSNSLISRILTVLQTKDIELIISFFKNIEDKQSGRKLKNEHIFDDLYKNNRLNFEKFSSNKFNQYLTYWGAYFLYLRKSNSK